MPGQNYNQTKQDIQPKKKTGAYRSWRAMQQRCRDPNAINFKHYGGKGVTICERWMKFEAFLEDMGERPPGMSIDRKDSSGPYAPWNCKWSTRSEQIRNRSMPDQTGERSGRARLTDAQVREIKHALASYYPGLIKNLAERYGVSKSLIGHIKCGDRWKHIL